MPAWPRQQTMADMTRFRVVIDREIAACRRATITRQRILWDDFGDQTAASIERIALALEPIVLQLYVGICSSPAYRFTMACERPHHERFHYMTVLSCGATKRLRAMERKVIRLLSPLAKLQNKSSGGEIIRASHGFIYLCYTMDERFASAIG